MRIEETNSDKSVFIGDDHSEEFWLHNYYSLREFKPDFLLLEVIGKHRYWTAKDRELAKISEVYMPSKSNPGYNSDAFGLADDLDIPMIGIDVWEKPYDFPKEWEAKDAATNFEHSHGIREANMVEVAKEFLPQGKVLLIIGAEHLRGESELYKFGKTNEVEIKFFKMTL